MINIIYERQQLWTTMTCMMKSNVYRQRRHVRKIIRKITRKRQDQDEDDDLYVASSAYKKQTKARNMRKMKNEE